MSIIKLADAMSEVLRMTRCFHGKDDLDQLLKVFSPSTSTQQRCQALCIKLGFKFGSDLAAHSRKED
jgi:hypothetical protein